MTKELNGRELAGYIKERQAHEVRGLRARKIFPKLVIIRDSDNPVIMKYVGLKQRYGEDIGVSVVDVYASQLSELKEAVKNANEDASVSGIIVQLPLKDTSWTDEVVNMIAPEKDVDGLGGASGVFDSAKFFDSATATAIIWLLAGYSVSLEKPTKIALVGKGRLVGAPLYRMFSNSGYDTRVFHRGDDLSELVNYDVIISATGQPGLIKSEYVKAGAVVVDAGTASEGGVLVGDVSDEVRERTDIAAITPKIGGVGPLTVTALFDDVIRASKE